MAVVVSMLDRDLNIHLKLGSYLGIGDSTKEEHGENQQTALKRQAKSLNSKLVAEGDPAG